MPGPGGHSGCHPGVHPLPSNSRCVLPALSPDRPDSRCPLWVAVPTRVGTPDNTEKGHREGHRVPPAVSGRSPDRNHPLRTEARPPTLQAVLAPAGSTCRQAPLCPPAASSCSLRHPGLRREHPEAVLSRPQSNFYYHSLLHCDRRAQSAKSIRARRASDCHWQQDSPRSRGLFSSLPTRALGGLIPALLPH